MCVNVERHTDVAVPHEVLQCLGVHPCLRLVTTIGVAADVRRNVRQLLQMDLIVATHRMVEPVLSVHRHFRHTIFVQIQKTSVAPGYVFFNPLRIVSKYTYAPP